MSKKIQFDPEVIRQLANVLVETELTELEVEADGCRIYVAKQHPPIGAQHHTIVPNMAPLASLKPHSMANEPENISPTHTDYAQHPGIVKSPMVGTAYLSSEPGTPHFVKEGDSVQLGQTLLIVEAMKVMNQIKAPRSGRILRLLVQNANPVEFDEPLLIIE